MSQFTGILTAETEKARKFTVAGRELWIPRSVIKNLTKFPPDAQGHRECLVDVEDWFSDKNEL